MMRMVFNIKRLPIECMSLLDLENRDRLTLLSHIALLLILILLHSPLLLQAQDQAVSDSSFWKLSMPEIDNYRRYYRGEIDRLQKEKQDLVERGIADGKRLLASPRHSDMVDEILVRLADLYYYQDQDRYFSAMDRYEAELEQMVETSQTDTLPPLPPQKDFNRSLSLYKRLIQEYPRSVLVQDALYNTGFLYEELGRMDDALRVYHILVDRFPESRYVPEAYMRIGEYYFRPPQNDLQTAIGYYQKIIDFGNSRRYAEAHYKLGWSYYKLSQYPKAISYFTTLIDHLDFQIDNYQSSPAISLRQEAVEYVAICFLDFGGPRKANSFVQSTNSARWGADMLVILGDIYKDEKEAYPYAIQAYQDALVYKKNSPDIPIIHQKIVDCYRMLDNRRQLFLARETLYKKFKTGSLWWRMVEDEEARLTAYQLAETAHRENIMTVIRQAQEQNDRFLFENAINLIRSYLDEFSENLYAYMIRWNLALILDSRLHRYEAALKEYLTISMVYNQEKYKKFASEKGLLTTKDAAANAIVMADTLVLRERRVTGAASEKKFLYVDSSNVDTVQDSFSVAEKWLSIAYDNYIKLFPFDEMTPTVLTNAGALHYTHQNYDESLRFFRTLMRYFPDSPQSNQVQYSILESYFAKGDYVSTETVAKKIIESDMPDSIKTKAERRMGEALFLRAEALAREGDTRIAAAEYHRMALETPQMAFADRALFNAGREYELLKDYDSAVRAYEGLRASYPSSSYLPDALNNMAFDYGELGQYIKGAERYAEYYNIMIDKPEAREALYNAHLFYVKGNAWEKAIETGGLYARKYPNEPDAETVLYALGQYYLFDKDTLRAIQANKYFTDQYPLSDKCVDAFYHSGILYQALGRLAQAEAIFYDAYTRNLMLHDSSQTGNDLLASEALFFSTRLLHARFEKIQFVMPQDSLKAMQIRNRALLDRLIEQYTHVITFQTNRLPECMFQLGALYDDYGHRWANQEMPAIEPAALAVRQKEVNAQTSLIYQQAFQSYQKAVTVLENLAEKTMADTAGMDLLEQTESDSLHAITIRWLRASREKISEMLYRIADINTISIDQLLAVPLPEGLSDAETYEYRSQVLLQAVVPLVEKIMNAHLYNLQVSDSMSLSNTWVEKSRSKILDMGFLPAYIYHNLTMESIGSFKKVYSQFRQLPVQSERMFNLAQAMGTFTDLSKSYALGMLHFYTKGLNRIVDTKIADSLRVLQEDSILSVCTDVVDTLSRLVQINKDQVAMTDIKFTETGELWYEDLLTVYEDNVYFLRDYLNAFMEQTHTLARRFVQPGQKLKSLEMRMIRFDLGKYGSVVSLKLDTLSLRTDSLWEYTPDILKDWQLKDAESVWYSPSVLAVYDDSLWSDKHVYAIFREDTLACDSTTYRREIFIPGMVISGTWCVETDPVVQCVVNGQPVTFDSRVFFSVTSYLREGKNSFGFLLHHSRKTPIKGIAQIIYIPFSEIPEG